jgi:hypothetical protein
MRRAIAAPILALALLGAPPAALGQSAGDEQYVDPFQGDGGGQQEQPAPSPQPQPAPVPEPQPAPAPEQPAAPAAPAEGGDGTTGTAPPAAEPAQAQAAPGGPTLPRTGAPVLLLGAAGYALLLAGIAIRRQT